MSNSSVKISVLMSCYNAENYIKESIESIINQTYSNFEFIIINDGSIDNSLEIIKSFKDERIILINQENKGLVKSLNNGLKVCKGEYVARMDADDISLPDRFEKQIEYLEKNKDVDVLSGAVNYIDESGCYLGRSFSITSHTLINKYLKNIGNVIVHPAVMMKKTKVEMVGGYFNLEGYEDYHLWNKMLRNNCRFANMSDVLINYRILPSSISVNNKFSVKNSKHFKEIINEDIPNKNSINNLFKTDIALPNNFRDKNFKNIENRIFQIALTFLTFKRSEMLITMMKNILAKKHLFEI